MKNTLISFNHYYDDDRITNQENLSFFIKHGLIEDENIDYNFIISSGDRGGDDIPTKDNVSVLRTENEGYDFGAWGKSLESVNIKNYNNFIFINDTCRGPFIPSYINNKINWVEMFLGSLSEEIKLVGPTWNTTCDNPHYVKSLPQNHIQTYCFGTDLVALQILIENKIFSTNNQSKQAIIMNHEVRASQVLRENGFKIKPFQLSQFLEKEHGDIVYDNKYFGATLNPIEIMFIKTNRIYDQTVKNYTKWLMNS